MSDGRMDAMGPEMETRIIESFSRHVHTYDRHAQLQRSMAERLAAFLPDPLPLRILEVGCGTGLFTRHLLARGARDLTLNDIAPAMLDYLAGHLEVPEGIRFLPGNAEQIAFPEVDLIVGNAVFQWFQNPEVTLRRLVHALEPGGRMLFSTFGPGTLADFREVAGLEGPTHLTDAATWRGQLTAAGLEILDFNRETRDIFFPGTRNLLRNLQQIGAAPLPVFRAGSLRRIMADYDHEFGTPHGVYTHWELYYFLASRTVPTGNL